MMEGFRNAGSLGVRNLTGFLYDIGINSTIIRMEENGVFAVHPRRLIFLELQYFF